MGRMETEHLSGTVERVTYYSDETGYCVLRLRPDRRMLAGFGGADQNGLITIVGNMPEIQPGEQLKVKGGWTTHAEYGKQFKAENVERSMPATEEGIRRYLASGLIKGVGPVTAKRIVKHFGEDTLDMLDTDPSRVIDVPGVGKYRARKIAEAWAEQQEIKRVMLFLQSHGVNTSLAVKIYKQYGDSAVRVVQEDPYRLAADIWGIGFKTADRIAQNLGLSREAPSRMEAGVVYALNQLTSDGHVYIPRPELVVEAAQLLEVVADLVDPAVDRLHKQGRVIIDSALPAEKVPDEPPSVYLRPFYFSEAGAAEKLHALANAPVPSKLRSLYNADLDSMIDAHTPPGVELAAQQREAVKAAILNRVTVLTGGPGTGKTTTLKVLLDILDAARHRYQLASPTGRAAKRMSEATGRPARTLHRMLEFSPRDGGFTVNEEAPLFTDMIIVDEVSMLDLMLFYNLLKAIPPGTHLLLVGDVDQLPSVGAGDVLRDVIASDAAAVIRLNVIFRQEAGSLIIHNAHRINAGEFPDTDNEGDDFFFFGAGTAAEAADFITDIVKNRAPDKFGCDPIEDIQVIAPMYRGAAGVSALNERLQAMLNPPNPKRNERTFGGRIFRVGDKLMQIRNNYDKDVFNGDSGRLAAIDLEEQTLSVLMDGRIVKYDWVELDELVHAYAVSVHRAQGSEYPFVVMPILTQHFIMLQRNLLYTAVTRAERAVILVGSRKAIAIAVNNDKVARRYSHLTTRIKSRDTGEDSLL